MEDPRPHRHPYLYIAAVWLAVGAVQGIQTVYGMRAAGMHHAWVRLFFCEILDVLPWALATPAVLKASRTLPVYKLKGLLTHLSFMVLIGVASALWDTSLEHWFTPWAPDNLPGPFLATWLQKSYGNLFAALVIYALLYTVCVGVDSRQKLARQRAETLRLNAELAKAQLHALRCQIEPHFIFNALNSISGMVRENKNAGAVNMIAALGDVLRRLTRETEATVTLKREMEFLEKYFEIQKLRFAERLNVVVTVPEELNLAEVPSLVLQPLVENAVKHGISQCVRGGTVQVAAARDSGELSLSVYNDGPPLSESWESGGGVGLSNLKSRLNLIFGAQARLDVASDGISGVRVSVTLPYRESLLAAAE
ncbi:MAG TPA: histidine kinase [Steroidobacteraceae bacterium]|jgi:two-component sensor histidine kinase